MNVREQVIAKKYAVAFLGLYHGVIDNEEMEHIWRLEEFLIANRHFYVSLRIPSLPYSLKEEVLDVMAEKFHLRPEIRHLMRVLLAAGRIEILHRVLEQLWYAYKKLHNIQKFLVYSSHELTKEEQRLIKAFAQSISNAGQLITKFYIDPSLIIGIRIESSFFLWERSIKKLLRNLNHTILDKG